MRLPSRRFVFGLGLAVFALGLSVVAGRAQADEIRLRDGRSVAKVEVTSEDYETVRYKIAGSEQREPAGNVALVVYSDKPMAYQAAEKALANGQFVEAAQSFVKAAQSPLRPWVKVYGTFYAAESYRRAARLDNATTLYEELLQVAPKTRFLPATRLGLGLCLVAKQDYTAARKSFGALADEAIGKGFGVWWKAEAQYQSAHTYELEGKSSEALRSYRELARTAREQKDVSARARVGALRLAGDPKVALTDLAAIIDDREATGAVRADAYLTRGKLLVKSGEHKGALVAFLRVCWDPPLREFSAERAEALHLAAATLEQVKTADWRARSHALRQELRTLYPTSRWAQ